MFRLKKYEINASGVYAKFHFVYTPFFCGNGK